MDKSNPTYDWSNVRGQKWCEHLSHMEAMLDDVDEPLLHALQLDAPYRIADIGCGGGGTTWKLQLHAPKGSVVHGFDISNALIQAASSRSKHDKISFEVKDIASSPPPHAPYDRLLSRFGIMFFDDPYKAFRNLRSWLAPHGRFVFATWGGPNDNQWSTSVRDIVAKIIDVPPYQPNKPGPFRYANANDLLKLLTQVGFSDLAVKEWRGSLPVGGGLPPKEAAHFALSAFSSFRESLEKEGPSAFNEAQHLLTKYFEQHQDKGIVRIEARVNIFTGSQNKDEF